MITHHGSMKMRTQDKKDRAVVLLSGGVDSSTTLAVAKSEGYELYALTFDYSQRHKRELASAKAVAKSLGVRDHLVIKFDLRDIGGSALTADIEVPKSSSNSQRTSKKLMIRTSASGKSSPVTRHPSPIPVTYVPARNTIFLSFALALAEVLGVCDIFIGANAVDYSGYPDCRPEYLKAFEKMANLATKASVEGMVRFRIRAPLLYLSKGEIIRKGNSLGLDYSLTWSCYDPQQLKVKDKVKTKTTAGKFSTLTSTSASTSLVPCRKCDSCLYREKGFKEAGIPDPLIR